MSWWQNKILRYGLRYGLQRTGLLEDTALDLDNLDISIGKQNVIELKDVGLNIERITKLAQLPPALRLEVARVLSLRLTIPADFYHSSIVVEVDGVDILARLQDEDADPHAKIPGRRARSPVITRTPQHRKMNRRLHSPPPYAPEDTSEVADDIRLPTTQEVAKSFLMDEPVQQRRELEAQMAASAQDLEESFVSESSEGGATGLGMGVGVPTFLASFLQGIVDRLKLEVKNVQVKIETEIPGDSAQTTPLSLRLEVETISVESLNAADQNASENSIPRRAVDLGNISLTLLSEDIALTDMSDPGVLSSQNDSKAMSIRSGPVSPDSEVAEVVDQQQSATLAQMSRSIGDRHAYEQAFGPTIPAPTPSPPHTPASARATVVIPDDELYQEVVNHDQDALLGRASESEIRPGDDNISWGSRQSQASAHVEDLWKSMVSGDDLPTSFIAEQTRISAPPSQSSRANSPLSARHRRPVSPYDRHLSSPGSWPRLDESPQRHRSQHGPGSWPALDQSHHKSFDPLDEVMHASRHDRDFTDNKRDAMEISGRKQEHSPASLDSSEPLDDMLQSRVFSHDEAQSMYMSAMTGSPEVAMPGGWSLETQSQRAESPEAPRELSPMVAKLSIAEPRQVSSGNVTPRPQTPMEQDTREDAVQQTIMEVLFIDSLSITLPTASQHDDAAADGRLSTRMPNARGDKRVSQGMPGTFSAYSDMSSSRRRPADSIYGEANSMMFEQRQSSYAKDEPSMDIVVGMIAMQVDVTTCRMLYVLSGRLMDATSTKNGDETPRPAKIAEAKHAELQINIELARLFVSVQEQLTSRSLQQGMHSEAGILDIRCQDIILRSTGDKDLRIGTFAVLLGGIDFLTFDGSQSDQAASHVALRDASVISLSIAKNRTGFNMRPVTDVSVHTAPAVFLIDLNKIDETFGTFGGLSGVLELGNSLLSESGSSPPVAMKAPKGVRFAGDMDQSNHGTELKLNARISGATFILRAPSCSVSLRTSTLKAIHRENGTIATVEHVSIRGPHLADTSIDAPCALDLATVRVEYLQSPEDKDLERLLSLLTPSKDKYDSDDDILIDTLLRQRRKGSLLRLAIGSANARVEHWEDLAPLTAVAEDLSKLSAMTKYLPEDDRPGLLVLLRLKEVVAQIPVNDRFGKLRIACQDLHLAHVGLPALLAFSVGSIDAKQNQGASLIHPLVPLAGADNLPVVMARMLGDEVEPTVKLKLFNLCVEYSVPVIIQLSDVDQEADTEELLTVVAHSIADLTMTHALPKVEQSPVSNSSKSPAKKLNIDLLLHDSAIGLCPRNMNSKALFVLSDAHISTAVPPEQAVAAKLELRKASIFVTDRVLEGRVVSTSPGRSISYTNTSHRLGMSLHQQGYVSVGSMMSAEVVLRVKDSTELGAKALEVDVKNELFLLETCADSTQTLIATLAALVPPAPPSRIPKYLLEPMPIEDLVNSFSGDALPKHEVSRMAEVLYDVEEDMNDEDFDMDLDMPYSNLYEEPDELLAESAMAGSLYGPVSGILTADDFTERQSTTGDDYSETAESLLEDDPFEMTTESDVRMGDAALIRDLGRQCKPAVNNDPVEIELYEVDDLGFDALGGGQQALGQQHRFNAPHAGKRDRTSKQVAVELPFRLRLRDFNIIWHLYDGYDWQRTRDGIQDAVEQVELRAEERKAKRRQSHNDPEDDESVIGDFLFNSIYIGIPADHDVKDLRRQINRGIDEDVSETASIPVSGISRPTTYSAPGAPSRAQHRRRLKLGRSKSHKISFELKGVSADVFVYPHGSGEVVSSVDLRLKDFEIYDKVPTSTWRKFLTHMTSDPRAREMSKPMFHILLDNVKTIESHSASEIMLHVTVLPLRLHVDQDALDFITRFFEFKDASTSSDEPEGEKPFIQRVEVDTVDMCLDYKPKNVDYAGLRSGKTAEFINFVTLEAANIRLRHAILYGLNGFEELHPKLNALWTPDITRNQLPGILAGLAPVRSLANLGMGVRDVVAIPVREYKKDGRIVRSIQKGAFHFGKTTASELARLGAKVALGTQTVLSNAEDLLSPPAERPNRPNMSRPTSADQGWHDVASDDEEPEQRAVSAYANQPLGLLQGLRSARRYLEHDLLTAKDALIAVQGEFLESRGPGDAAVAVVKHAPTVILRPVIGATRAVGTTLLGMGNQIDRDHLRRIDDKYKRR